MDSIVVTYFSAYPFPNSNTHLARTQSLSPVKCFAIASLEAGNQLSTVPGGLVVGLHASSYPRAAVLSVLSRTSTDSNPSKSLSLIRALSNCTGKTGL